MASVALADALQLAAFVNLANHARPSSASVPRPTDSGRRSVAALPLAQAQEEIPKAIIGLADIAVRAYPRKFLGRDPLSFAAPWSLFQEMEDNAGESFLCHHVWGKFRETLARLGPWRRSRPLPAIARMSPPAP
jgi:hypothetical protein